MSYTTVALVRENNKRFSSSALVSDDKINYIIARVQGLIDGILFKIYRVPLYSTENATPFTPEIIVTIATDLVTAKLMKYFYDSNQSEENPTAKNLWKENIDLLKSMVDNKPDIILPCDFRAGVSLNEKGTFEFGSATNSASGIWSTALDQVDNAYKPIFNLDDWPDSKLDINQETDIYNDRIGY